jgi:hypothetical protein
MKACGKGPSRLSPGGMLPAWVLAKGGVRRMNV